MRRIQISILLVSLLVGAATRSSAQSMHFSQYYNAPLLLNPANTALMPEYDYRIGVNYRNQWSTLPVPFNTTSAFGDFKIGGNAENGHPNWLGIGLAIFSDKAGSGDLSLLQYQGSLAYHLHLSPRSLLSFGAMGSRVQRSVDFDKLTYDVQWDGFNFNKRYPTGEKFGLLKTGYTSVAAGFNLSFFPNEGLYFKIGGGFTNINKPNESFYDKTNPIGLRPTANIEFVIKAGSDVIFTPSIYYTTQNSAYEAIAGGYTRINMNHERDSKASQLILGLFDRWGDAVIGVAGYQFGGVQIMANYDMTMSTLTPYNGSYGALEFSLIWGGNYSGNEGARKMYACPRF